MQGLWIEKGELSLRENLSLSEQPGEVRVKVLQAGICGTDLELLRGYYNFSGVPGHEFVGEVLTAGPWCGARIVADINFACGQCEFCKNTLPHHCLSRRTLGINQASGAFAEEISLPQDNLVVIPEHVPNEHAVFAEPLAAALQILDQVDLKERSVLLIGAGRLGRMIAWVIDRLVPDAALSVAIRNQVRIEQLPPSVRIVQTDNLNREYDVSIDCTGNQAGFGYALDVVKAKGTLVIKSTYADKLTLDMSRVVVDEIQLIGSRCGPMDKAVQFLTDHPEVFENMETRMFAFEDHQQAFQLAGDSMIDKVLFQS